MEEWERICDSWGTGPIGSAYYSDDTPDHYWLHGVWKGIAAKRVSSFVVIGRLSVAVECAGRRSSLVQAQLDEVKAKIHTFFQSKVPPSAFS